MGRNRMFNLQKATDMIGEIVLTPEMTEKRNRLASLRAELADLFEKREFMVSHERDQLTALYTSLIGKLQYEEYALKVAVSRLRRKSELVQAKRNRGEKIDLEAIEQQVENEFWEHQQKIQRQLDEIRAADALLNAPILTEEDTAELKNIYRVLVKRLHPDWNVNQTEQEKELFVRAQSAYKMADLQELRNILLVLNKEKSIDELKGTNIDEEIAKLEHSRDDLKMKIDQLNEKFPFTYRERLADYAWVKSEQEKLKQSIQDLKKEQLAWEGFLSSQLGMFNTIGEA